MYRMRPIRCLLIINHKPTIDWRSVRKRPALAVSGRACSFLDRVIRQTAGPFAGFASDAEPFKNAVMGSCMVLVLFVIVYHHFELRHIIS